MWATLPLLCAGAWLLGVPVCGAAELCVNSLGKTAIDWSLEQVRDPKTEI
uniref:Cathepsin H n=1 Tax=Homo sapiens TaxID=9606 RepID=A0A7I2V4N9_HUMAN